MTGFTFKLLFGIGMISLFHTAYSAAQYRSYLRITEQDFVSLPADIRLQGLISLLITMYSILHIAGDFKEIRANIQLANKSWDTVGNHPTFYMFSHRGRALSPNYNVPKVRSTHETVDPVMS